MSKKFNGRRKLTRQEQRDLDIEIGFIEGVIRRDPHYVEALQVLGDDYTKRQKFGEGLRIDEQLAQLRPDDALVQYNLACSYSLTSQFELAVATLERAIHAGYSDFKWLAKDPDLAPLRKHPAFDRIREKIRSVQTRAE